MTTKNFTQSIINDYRNFIVKKRKVIPNILLTGYSKENIENGRIVQEKGREKSPDQKFSAALDQIDWSAVSIFRIN